MVRVNYPPGGHTMFQAEGSSREPQTVRILQPPGGSSSISFTDDDQVQNGSRSKSSNEKSTFPVHKQEPNLDSKPEEESTNTVSPPSEESNNQNGVKGKVSYDNTPDIPHVAESVESNADESPVESVKLDNESTEFPMPKDFENASSNSNKVDESVSEKVVKEVEVSESVSEKQSEVVSEVSVEESSSVSVSKESSETKVEVSSVTEDQTQETVSESVSVNKESNSTIEESESQIRAQKEESNGVSKNHDLPPLHIPKNEPSSTTTTPSPSVSSPPIKPNEETRNRVVGEQAEKPIPQQQAPPRKIKDHMRSNIFMSDEDYLPVRSSRMNATVNDTKQEAPAAGQRQRIPPGGFSTKLW